MEIGDRIITHSTSVGCSSLGTPYNAESVGFLDFCESTSGGGERKIWRMREFVDSAYARQWFEKEREKIAEQKVARDQQAV